MRQLLAMIVLALVIMSPQAMDALGEITHIRVTWGIMSLTAPMSGMIYAIGERQGREYTVKAKWSNGLPHKIHVNLVVPPKPSEGL